MPQRAPIYRPPRTAGVLPDRLSASQRGYGWSWQKYRRQYLAAHPLCARCSRPAMIVDHVEPVNGANDPGFWPESNHQALCVSCHALKTQNEDKSKGRGLSRRTGAS